MNIYIPIEIKVRELEGRLLLALAAAERGHTVVVGEKKDTIGLATKGMLPPGIVHLKSITPHDSMKRMLANLLKNGHRITVQDEEGGQVDEEYSTFAKLRFSSTTIASVDRVFSWGNFDNDSLNYHYPEFKEKFIRTGSPRVDFWRKDFAKYHVGGKESTLLDGKPFIMIVSNFGGFLNENRFYNVMARLRQAGYFDRENGRERHEFENMAYQSRMIGEFVFMIRELADYYSDYNILVRPHPVETIEGWKKLIGDYPGIYVNRIGTISRWIRNAELIIHNGCTSALEAAVGHQNRIAYRPIPHDIERSIPNRVSINTFHIEELKQMINGFLNGEKLHEQSPKKQEIFDLIKYRYSAISGRLAADRIVDVWDDISNLSGSSPGELMRLKKEKKIPIKHKIKRKLVLVRNFVFGKTEEASKNPRLLKSSFKFPEFTTEEFENIKSKLENNLDRFEDVAYKRFGGKSFILFKNDAHKS